MLDEKERRRLEQRYERNNRKCKWQEHIFFFKLPFAAFRASYQGGEYFQIKGEYLAKAIVFWFLSLYAGCIYLIITKQGGFSNVLVAENLMNILFILALILLSAVLLRYLIGMVFVGIGHLMTLVVYVVTLGHPIKRTTNKIVEIATEQSEIEDQLGL
ncbi:MAG: hypothetical protein SOY39_09200 [Lachnospiraceae bacterium]|nr:hypothetical protein [Lachnospiraceae bacterium]